MDNEIIIINQNDLEISEKTSHSNSHEPYEFYRYEAAKTNGPGSCLAAVYLLPPGKSNYPYHCHMANTETFYIISGSGILKTPSGEREISAGDLIVCPAGKAGAHKITNTSDKPLKYIDVDADVSPDVIYYPDSNKTGVVCGGVNTCYSTEKTADYYEGE